MSSYPDLRAFAVHPTTSLCSARFDKELTLFDKRCYKDGALQRGYNIDDDNLLKIKEFMGSYLSPEELLAYCVSMYHLSHLTFYQEHLYYKLILNDNAFIRLHNGDWVRSISEYSLNLIDFYFYKYPNNKHTDLYLDLYTNYSIINKLMPGFGGWLSGMSFTGPAQQFISYWYGGRDHNYWSTLKPTLREKRLPYEPEYEWIFDESKYPDPPSSWLVYSLELRKEMNKKSEVNNG